MTCQSVRYSASEDRRRQVISRNLANFLNLFLLSSLLPVKFSPQPLGWTLGAIRQSAQGAAQEPNGAGNEKDVRTLEPGQSIKRELAGGQEHTYQIKLSVDQFLKMVVEQQGIDVAVQVMGPDGSQIFRFNSEISLRDNELAPLVAEATGDYRLIVQPTQKLAAVGAYEIRIEEMRAATENDRALHEARKLFDEARKLRDAGKYDEALPLFERVIETRQRILGPDDRDLADVFFNLAVFYFYKGNYLKAEPLSNRALAIQEKTLGPEHSDVANSLNLLAGLYFNKGDYEKAEPLSNRALAIKEKALGPEHSDLAFYLNKLALIYDKKGEYHKAEPLYVRALAIREKTLGPEHPFLATSLNNLANLYYKKGDYAKAESLHRRALTIREKWLGPGHRSVAESLGNLANIYRDRKDYAQAEPLYLRALAIQEKTLGPQSPHIARTLNYLAMFYLAKGDIARSIAIQSRANAVTEYNLSLNLDPGSERQKLAFLALVSEQTDFTLSLHSQAAPDNPQALNLAFTTLLRRKARGLDAMTDTIAALRLHATPRDKELFDRLADARSQLAELTLRESGATLPETSTAQLRPLEERVETLEAELSIRSAEFRAQAQPITLAAVQAALPADSVLVEFVVHTPWNTRAEKRRAPRYLAYVLSAQGQPKWADLGETAPIDRAVGAWRRALRDPRRTNFKQLGRVVDEKVMRPVRSLLGDRLGETSHLLIAPAGSLNHIPFAALVDEQNRYLVERFAISYLTCGRDLLRLQTSEPSKNAPLVVANPAFGRVWPIAVRAAQSSGEGLAADQARVQIDPARIIFQPLPGTEYEALAIKAVLPEASVLLREQATEAVLKQARAPRILHIATHGFFLGDQDSLPKRAQSPVNNNQPRAFNLQLSRRIAQVENPLLRSGLALAGANQGKNGDDDGVLTALEAAGLDLWGTKLVVLSACDTGVGEVKKSEGVQGLRRALVLAGSESQVMSLWPVSDEGAKELMIEYYRALRQGEGRCEGLRQVQLRMLRSKYRRHPFYWAAFIQSGEWANLEGKR
jgi:CHAT domain-containing protein/Tfp pilus assembly protein PilF